MATYATVNWIKVGSTFCMVQTTEEDTGMVELFHLWMDGEEMSAFERIKNSMHLSMIQDALVHRLRVELQHFDDSPIVEYVILFKERNT